MHSCNTPHPAHAYLPPYNTRTYPRALSSYSDHRLSDMSDHDDHTGIPSSA